MMMMMVSDRYAVEKLIFGWAEIDNITVNRAVRLPGMTLSDFYARDCDQAYVYAQTDSYYMKGLLGYELVG